MPYRALKILQVTRGGKNVRVEPGELVPEAETWTNRHVWIENGSIEHVAAPPPQVPLFPESKPARAVVTGAPDEPRTSELRTTRAVRRKP